MGENDRRRGARGLHYKGHNANGTEWNLISAYLPQSTVAIIVRTGIRIRIHPRVASARTSSPISHLLSLPLSPHRHLPRRTTRHTSVPIPPERRPRDRRAPALAEAPAACRPSAKYVLVLVDADVRGVAKVVVVMLVAHTVTTHLVHVCAACPASRRARDRTDEGRAVRV
jgi:hypothetical protein